MKSKQFCFQHAHPLCKDKKIRQRIANADETVLIISPLGNPLELLSSNFSIDAKFITKGSQAVKNTCVVDVLHLSKLKIQSDTKIDLLIIDSPLRIMKILADRKINSKEEAQDAFNKIQEILKSVQNLEIQRTIRIYTDSPQGLDLFWKHFRDHLPSRETMETIASNTTKIEADWIYCDTKQNKSLLLSTKTKRKKVVLTGTCAALKEVINNKNFKLIHENIDPLFQKKSTYRTAFHPNSKKRFHFDSVNNNDIIAATIDIWPYIQQSISIPDYDIHVFLKESEEANLDMLEANIEEPVTFICSTDSDANLISTKESTTSLYAELLRNSFLLSQSVELAKDIAFVQKSINKLQSQKEIAKLEDFYGPLKELTLHQQEMLTIIDCDDLKRKILRFNIVSAYSQFRHIEINDDLTGIAWILKEIDIDLNNLPPQIKYDTCKRAFIAFDACSVSKLKEVIDKPATKIMEKSQNNIMADRVWGEVREQIERDYTYTPSESNNKTEVFVSKWLKKILDGLGIKTKIQDKNIVINQEVENNFKHLRAHSFKNIGEVSQKLDLNQICLDDSILEKIEGAMKTKAPNTILNDNFGIPIKYERVLRAIKLKERDSSATNFIPSIIQSGISNVYETLDQKRVLRFVKHLEVVENVFGVTSIESPTLNIERQTNHNLTHIGILDEYVAIKDFLVCMNGQGFKYDKQT